MKINGHGGPIVLILRPKYIACIIHDSIFSSSPFGNSHHILVIIFGSILGCVLWIRPVGCRRDQIFLLESRCVAKGSSLAVELKLASLGGGVGLRDYFQLAHRFGTHAEA